jgi:hypothetical protein
MDLFRWLRHRRPKEDPRLTRWRRDWYLAVEAPSAPDVTRLRSTLDSFGATDDDVEIEREMLEGLGQVVELQSTVAAAGLPAIDTGHRVVGTDVCHFIAPASKPDDPTQPSGRLILTNRRALFVGSSAAALPWHAVGDVAYAHRDIVLVRTGGEITHRYRCNSFGEALRGSFIARELIRLRTTARSV